MIIHVLPRKYYVFASNWSVKWMCQRELGSIESRSKGMRKVELTFWSVEVSEALSKGCSHKWSMSGVPSKCASADLEQHSKVRCIVCWENNSNFYSHVAESIWPDWEKIMRTPKHKEKSDSHISESLGKDLVMLQLRVEY